MQQISKLAPPKQVDRAMLPYIAIIVLFFLLLVVALLFVLEFRSQSRQIEQNQEQISSLKAKSLTGATLVQERGRLEGQLAVAQQQVADSSGLLPGSDVEVAVLQRILEAARLSGVELSTLTEEGPPVQEGSLVGWRYEIAALGPLMQLTDFVTRLEQEAFPAAFVSEPFLTENREGRYVLTGLLTVYGSTLSTSPLVEGSPLPSADGAQLRAEAQDALNQRDYERALSLLLRLKAQEPGAADVDQLLYNAYVAYGMSLLTQDRSEAAKSQCEAALAINPNGQEAVQCLLAVSQRITPTEGAIAGNQTPGAQETVLVASLTPTPLGADASPTLVPTVPPPPTRTPAPPPPPPATQTTLPTFTPLPTNTAGPSPTSGPSPTITMTPTEGPSPTPTLPVTPYPYPFGVMGTFYQPNCGLTQVKGTIRDSSGGAVNGVTVRVWFDGAQPDQFYSRPSGTDPTRGAGEWDVVLANYPKAGRWYVAVVDRSTGTLLSEAATVETDDGPCKPGQSGRQIVIQDFVRISGAVGTALPTSTPSVVPSTTTIPTMTTTPTATPTVSPTATQLPFQYDKDEVPDKEILYGASNQITSTLQVADDVKIRQLRVYLSIVHNDMGDLQIDLYHPDGTRIRIHAVDEDKGKSSLSWLTLSGNALAMVQGKSAQGEWKVTIQDRYEPNNGTFRSWTLEVYP